MQADVRVTSGATALGQDACALLAGDDDRRGALLLARAQLTDPEFPCIAAGFNAEGFPAVAAAVIRTPGRLGMLCHRARAGAAPELIEATIRRALEEAFSNGCALVQCTLESPRARSGEPHRLPGMQHLATLAGMERAIRAGESPAPVQWPLGVELQSIERAGMAALTAVIPRTHLGTLDCPNLAGLRTTEDTLAGYQALGRFEPSRWAVLLRHGCPIGAALVSPVEDRSAQLIYLGLVPEGRGLGMGHLLVRECIRAAAKLGERFLSLSCDMANAPALHIYRKAGFSITLQREAFIAAARR